MGNYSYSIVVEQSGKLLINKQEVPVPAEIAEQGGDSSLSWALDEVREAYRNIHEADPDSILNLTVRDERPGGPVRRAKFIHPDQGITIDSFLAGRSASRNSEPASVEGPTTAGSDTSIKYVPKEVDPDPSEARTGVVDGEPAAVVEPEVPAPVETPSVPRASKASPSTDRRPVRDGKRPANQAAVSPQKSVTYEEKVRDERGWTKVGRASNTRPEIGSAENSGKPKKSGLKAEAQKQKVIKYGGIALVIILVIVGFRIFNGGTSFDAICVDQRTMTRTVTGVACENDSDTNHRWWYTSDSENLPQPGDTVPDKGGSFNTPNEDKNSVIKHVEQE